VITEAAGLSCALLALAMATAVPPTTTPIPRGRVLIVDDDDLVRATTAAALTRRGFDVVQVSSGAEALGYLARDAPALMLLDLNMDDMTGWEVLSHIQREPRLRNMKTIVVSGEQSPQIPRRFGFMRKPFRLEALLEMIGVPATPVT
jgi:CheY-like chemotaxis protein